MLIISPLARISSLADIEESVRGTCITIAAGAVIDAFVKIRTAGGMGDVVIGPDCHINSGCVIYTGNGIYIGSKVLIAANCTLAPTNHAYANTTQPIAEQGFMTSRGGITIGDDCWIGAGSVLLDGAVIGAGCVIGALSLVRDSLPPRSICYGQPARPVGMR